MVMIIEWALVMLFAAHLLAFLVLAVRRRTYRYAPALVTFALLVALNLCIALGIGDEGLYSILRGLAFVGLAVSVLTWLWSRRAG
ncbi:MAG: hypothetical protein QF464_14195 [Myxococcota bacterium]|nr:hypothetical protein [Myxococcota bacterium]